MQETKVLQALGLDPDESLQERGVFYPADHDDQLAQLPSGVPRGHDPGPGEVILTDEWLNNRELSEHFSADTLLQAALPQNGSQVKRADVEPRILLFEHLPPPVNSFGQVHYLGDGSWVMDSRGEPAALVFSHGDRDVVIWGQEGAIRLFSVQHAR